MNFQGIITYKSERTEVGKKSTPKISLVIEELGKKQYKDSLMIDRLGDDKVALVEKLSVGLEIAIQYNNKVTEYNGKYYNNLNGWECLSKPIEEEIKDGGDFDDLPF